MSDDHIKFSSREDDNPFRAPSVLVDLDTAEYSDDELLRRAYLGQEEAIKSIALIYVVFGAIFMFFAASRVYANPVAIFQVQATVATGGVGALFVVTAFGMLKFQLWGRIAGGITAALMLPFGFPCTLLFSVWFLMVICSSATTKVFSREYQDVVARTPDVRYRSSWQVKSLLWGTGILLAIAGILALWQS